MSSIDRSAGSTRRTMLKTGAAAAAAALTTMQPAEAQAQSAERNPRNMRVSLAAYSVRQALQAGDMDLFGFIDWCAEMDLDGTELTSYYFRKNFGGDYLRELKLHAFRNGVTVSGTAIANNFCHPPGRERREQIDHVKQWIDHAVGFSAPHIRVFAGNVPDGVDNGTAIGWVAESMRECLDYAAERGVVLGLENHGGITARAADHLAICDAVGDHPWFGINLDTGNYRTNPYEELAMSAPRTVNVQVKVEVFRPDGTKVRADLKRFRDILADAGYKGWVALEYEADANPFIEIPQYVQELKALFER